MVLAGRVARGGADGPPTSKFLEFPVAGQAHPVVKSLRRGALYVEDAFRLDVSGHRGGSLCTGDLSQHRLRTPPHSRPAGDAAPVTFARDVAPILQKNCQQCHQPGSIGPMALTTFEEVRPWARAIKQKVVAGEMPPYRYDRHVGIQDLKYDLRLTEAEIQTIARWVDSGSPLGNRADLPAPITFPDPTSGRSRRRSDRRTSSSRRSRSRCRPAARTHGGGRSCRPA